MTERLPPWLRRPKISLGEGHALKKRLHALGLHTVCEEARCPNLAECYSRTTATFLIMGPVCTRGCGFCNIATGTPSPLDADEPERVAQAAASMQLRHVVVTSVTRDDLPLGGAPHFRHAAEAIRRALPSATVEMLTPDFQGDEAALQHIADAPMAVFNHNMETVASLFPAIRPQADYRRSLGVLRRLREWRPESMTKSGFMLGLGETADEVKRLLDDLCTSGVMAVIIGQYLRPRLAKTPVVRYAHPDEFIAWRDRALSMGFRYVASAPLVRSSYHADSFTAD